MVLLNHLIICPYHVIRCGGFWGLRMLQNRSGNEHTPGEERNCKRANDLLEYAYISGYELKTFICFQKSSQILHVICFDVFQMHTRNWGALLSYVEAESSKFNS